MFQIPPLKTAKVVFISNQLNFSFKKFWKNFFLKVLPFDILPQEEFPLEDPSRLVRKVQKEVVNSAQDFLDFFLCFSLREMFLHLLNLHSRLKVLFEE